MARRRSNFSITIFVIICIIIICILVQYIIQIKQEKPIQPIQVQHVQIQNESKYDMAPEPLRRINIPTRGIPDDFQSIGVISIDDKILPIYGRRFDSDRWNYYTRTDTYNPVPIPIYIGKRDCMDVGCKEIMTGEEVEVMNKHGKVNIYKYGPKYIGFI